MDFFRIIKTNDTQALAKLGYADPARALKDLKRLSQTPFKEALEVLGAKALRSAEPAQALNNLVSIAQSVEDTDLKLALKESATLGFLVTLAGASQLFTRTMCRHPELLKSLFFDGDAAGIYRQKGLKIFLLELDELIGDASDSASIERALRIYKHKQYVRIGLRDLAELASLEEVTAEISELASASLEIALAFSSNDLIKRYGPPLFIDKTGTLRQAGFTILGMGKLGGGELNYFSDIDLIYIYESGNGESAGIDGKASTKIALPVFFVKLAEKVTKLIGAITENGNVFRVDLDLRPEGRSGKIANSLDSAELYYESWGHTWERSAMIKARPVAGSMQLGQDFLKMIEPFVYRKYLDFRAIEEIKDMKERVDIDLKRTRPDILDVKLGIGGIREIEFFVQALQLIHGGRILNIRGKNTLSTIKKLVDEGLLERERANVLADGYCFLRRVEHRLQIIEGLQTQSLPTNSEEADRVARMMGHDDCGGSANRSFMEEYLRVTAAVYEIYRNLFYNEEKEFLENKIDDKILILFSPSITDEQTVEALAGLNIFSNPATATRSLKVLKEARPGARLTQKAQEMLKNMAPFLFEKTLETPDPDSALSNLEAFLILIGSQTTFYSLLRENPKVAELLITIFGTSQFLTRTLLEQKGATDHLLSNDLTTPRKNKETLARELRLLLKDDGWVSASDATAVYEDLLDTIRRFKGREILRIGINDILGELSVDGVTEQITSLAEVVLECALKLASSVLSVRFGTPGAPGISDTNSNKTRFVIIALGKLGSGELIYGSDLDIVFVYSNPTDGRDVTTGPQVVSNHEYFVKLAQKIISILTMKTKEGKVFDLDMRLRPSGSSGPLVVTKSSLLKYQRERAEIWEAQAMIKARAVAGDMAFASGVTDELREIVFNRGLNDADLFEIKRIRSRMENEIAKEGPGRYNIKTGRGASVDIEFLVQALQLKYGSTVKKLWTPTTLLALDALADTAILSTEDHLVLREAYVFFKTITCKLRIVHDRAQGCIIEGSKELSTLVKRLGYDSDDATGDFLKDYLTQCAMVREIYSRKLAHG